MTVDSSACPNGKYFKVAAGPAILAHGYIGNMP
jgi:hypothetical protein